ncbi:MAG: hypothetical protein ACRC1W_12250 [Shewanella sp.]
MYQTGQLKQIRERVFYAVGGGGITLTTAAIVPFTIPQEAQFVSMLLIAPGGGGSGGATGLTNTTRSGGGGGGPGGTSTALYTARTLPETIYLILPNGGVGGIANTSATATTIAIVTADPSSIATVPSNQFLHVTFGAIGLVAGGGGAAGTVSSVANCQLAARALALNFNAGTAAGGAAGNPGVSTVLAGLCSPGAGGGSTVLTAPSAGGSVNPANAVNVFRSGSATIPRLAQGGVTATPLNGADGFDTILCSVPFGVAMNGWYSIGGAGGASIDVGTGGRGGNGGIGSGGGGGGAGTTGGAGGNGGPSFCLIEWW